MVRLPMPIPRPRLRPLAALVVVVLALTHLAALNPTPLAGEPRPPLGEVSDTDRFVPPPPATNEGFATFPVRGPGGESGLWLLPRQNVPLSFQVEREVAERFGLAALEEAVETFNDVPGTRFGARISGVVDDGVEERRRDGVNRIFLDRQGCGERFLARAHLWSDPVRVRDGQAVRDVREVDIGLCDRLSADAMPTVVRHELAHIAGLDHLCDPDDDCHRPGMGDDNRCRIMYPSLHPCQEVERGDLDGLVHLYPRLPRAGGGDGRSASARVARVTHPVPRSAVEAVVSAYDAPLSRQILSATLAAHRGVPHLLLDADCTVGPDGAALNRVLALTGTVTAVGALPDPCRTALEGSWQLEVAELQSTAEVLELMVEGIGAPPTRLVVAGPPGVGRRVPTAAAAGGIAGVLGAPLIVLGEELDPEPVLEALAEHPTIGEVLIAGDVGEVPTRALTALAEADVALRRLAAPDAAGVSQAALELPVVERRHPLGAAVVGEEHPEHAPASVALAGAVEGLVLPVERRPGTSQLQMLDQAFTRGAIVGGPQAVNPAAQARLSRALDGRW